MIIRSRIARAIKDEGTRRIWVDWTQIFANCCVPLSIFVAIWVFSAQRHDQQVQLDAQIRAQQAQDQRAAAMQFVMLKHQDSFLKPAAEISNAFGQPQILELFKQLHGPARQQLLAERTNKAGLDNFATMAELYRAIIACREAKSCDATILDDAYRAEITQFYCLSRDYALPELASKLNNPEYGTPLASYAQTCGV